MAITNYTELQQAVTNWLHRTDMASIIPDLITLGEGRIWRNLRVRQMEETLSGTVSSGVVALPSDYVDLKFAYVSSVNPLKWLERKNPEWIYRNDPNRSVATPKYIAREQTNFIFSPLPSDGTTIAGVYYKRLSSVASAVNAIFTSHPGLWLFGALAESAPYLVDDKRLPLWEAKFTQLLGEVNSEEYRENSSGSRLAMTAE